MPKTRQLLLGSLTALLALGLSTATASAKISYEWYVNGNLLKEKETRAFDGASDGHIFDFHAKLLGINVLMLSNSGSLKSGAVISGGKPGGGEGTIAITGVTVDPPLQKCVVETGGIPTPTQGVVETKLLKGEIVEGENGEVLILFTPKEGSTFVELKFLNKGTEECAANGASAEVTGSILGLLSPQRTEVLRGDLTFEAAEHNFFLASGTLNTAGLTFGAEAATLTGLALVLLTSDAIAGAF